MGLPKLISQLSSIEITKLPNLKEVKTALFRIDSNKTPGLDGFGAWFLETIIILSKRTFLTAFLNFLRIKNLKRNQLYLHCPSLKDDQALTDYSLQTHQLMLKHLQNNIQDLGQHVRSLVNRLIMEPSV